MDTGISLARADMYIRLEHHQPVTAQRERDRCQPLAYTLCQTRRVVDKERTVCTQWRNLGSQLLAAQPECKQLVERNSHVCRVARTATQTRTERDALGETDIHIADLRVMRLHAAVALENQIVVISAVHNQA